MKLRPKQNALPINVEERLYEMLNDVYPEVEIAGLTFLPGDIIKELDPVAFKIMVNDEWAYMLDEGYVEIGDELYHNDDVEPYGIDLTGEN